MENELDKIVYKKIARKDLSFGCKFMVNRYTGYFNEATLALLKAKHWKCVLSWQIERNEEGDSERILVKKEDLIMKNNTNYIATVCNFPCLWGGFSPLVSRKGLWTLHIMEKDVTIHYLDYRSNTIFEDYFVEYSFIKEIIWHPILLSDVLSFINIWIRDSDDFDKASQLIKKYESLVWIWNPSKPHYEEQLEVCKEFIRNLCK